MFDDTTEAAMICQCGHPALSHLHADEDESCQVPGCACAEFVKSESLGGAH